jgi:hypothetical protein
MVYTVVLEATAARIESSSLSLGTKQWSRSINGDAVDCKSAAFGHAWFDPRILHQDHGSVAELVYCISLEN